MSDDCRDHPGTPAVATCARCGRSLCDTCFCARVDARPACARCAHYASTRASRRRALAVAFAGIGGGEMLWAERRFALLHEHLFFFVGMVVSIVGIALLIARSASWNPPIVEARLPVEHPPQESDREHAGSPYRAGFRRVVAAVSPEISGRATVLVVLVALVGSAVLLPASVKLPRWVEAEIVFGAWWAILVATLTALLFKDFRLKDDFALVLPWNRVDANGAPKSASWSSGWGNGCSSVDGCSGADGDGCAAVVVGALFMVVAVALAWLFVEIALPVLFVVAYSLLMRAIRRAGRDHHDCAGDLPRSLGWGAVWATLYLAPLAALTALVHFAHFSHH